VLAGFFGIAIAVFRGVEVIAAGTVSLLVGFLYNGGPRPLSRTPFGELYAGGFLGSVLLILSYYVQAASVTLYAFLISLPSFFLIASILTSNNTCDMEGDRAAGRKTLTVVIGKKKSELLVYILGGLSFLLYFLYAGVSLLPLYGILPGIAALVYVLIEYRKMHRTGYSHETKAVIMFSILRVTLAYSLSVIVTIVIEIVRAS
jgi:1,4-dihydroxy-2-naphthoate octaprenyltransferase